VPKRPCLERAEWRLLHGKPPVRLSSYYHLACDYGTGVLISWEKGGVAPIYLCENHASQPEFSGEASTSDSLSESLSAPSVIFSNPAEEATHSAPPSPDIELRDTAENESVAPITTLRPNSTPNNSASDLADETNGNMAREDFEAYGTVLRSKPPVLTEEHAQGSDAERVCLSDYGERCTYESTVHCPKCRKWFCDVHGEDGNWHCCVRKM